MPPVYGSTSEKKELEVKNGALQALQVIHEIEQWEAGVSRITPALLLSLQHRAIVNIYSCAGTFRSGPVSVKDGEAIVHEPPLWKDVPCLVDEMCAYVNDRWNDLTPVHIGSYLMWRLNWIHPFFGGNGRTSRSISYIALCARLGFRMPGRKTIPDLIVDHRSQYISALRSADAEYVKGDINVSEMENLMESVMAEQMVDLISQATGKSLFT